MDVAHLVKMANEIAAFFAAEAGAAEAPAAVATHLRRYWAPPMRAQAVAHLAAGGEGFSEVARAAVGRLRDGVAA